MDACRNGLPSFSKSATSASLAPMNFKGVFIAYATDSGNTASDNGMFSKYFIENAKQPKKLTDIFEGVKNSLAPTSQLPVILDRTVGVAGFYFTGSKDDDPKALKANYYQAKTFENKALLAFMMGDKTKDLMEYRKAWLYGLEAEKLQMPERKVALKQSTLNQLTELSVTALTPEEYVTPSFVNVGAFVNSLIYSPNGGVLASGLKDGAIKLWDANTGKLKRTLKGHDALVISLSYSPDGGVLASGAKDGIKLWDANTGELKQTLKGHERGVYSLSYSPDGSVLASGSENGIKLWTPSILQTQALFYQYDPKQVSAALQFLWEMGLDDDGLTFVHKVRKPNLYPIQGRYYGDTQFLPLLDYPAKGKTKADQLIQWLEDKKAYKKQ